MFNSVLILEVTRGEERKGEERRGKHEQRDQRKAKGVKRGKCLSAKGESKIMLKIWGLSKRKLEY